MYLGPGKTLQTIHNPATDAARPWRPEPCRQDGDVGDAGRGAAGADRASTAASQAGSHRRGARPAARRVLRRRAGAHRRRSSGRTRPELLLSWPPTRCVESQLILHGLHPLDVDERIEHALDRVRPYLGSHAGGVAYLGVDDGRRRPPAAGRQLPRLPVRRRSPCSMTIEEAVLAAAPELHGIEVDGAVEDEAAAADRAPARPRSPAPTFGVAASRRRPNCPRDGRVSRRPARRAAGADGQARRTRTTPTPTRARPAARRSSASALDGDVLTCAVVRRALRRAPRRIGRSTGPAGGSIRCRCSTTCPALRIALVPEAV